MDVPKHPRRLGPALALLVLLAGGFPSLGVSQNVTSATPEPTTGAKWSDLENDTYGQRAHFAAGVARLEARLNHEIGELKAKRALMTTDTKDWDFAMKDVLDSRDLFTSRATEVGKANTPDSWADAKDRLGEAWHRVQLAVDKMHTTVTN